ncbi:16395_t:CDS:2, partial [Dentiscutata heterogama]
KMIHRRFTVFIIILSCTISVGITSALQVNQDVISDLLLKRQASPDTTDTSSSMPAPTLPGTQLQMQLVVGPTAASALLALCAISIIGGGITRMFSQKDKSVNIITNNEYKELEDVRTTIVTLIMAWSTINVAKRSYETYRTI